MGDYVIKTGDFLQITFPPPAVIPLLLQPCPLSGTSPNVKIMKMAACLVGDELPPALRQPMPYTSPPYVTPGTGTLQIILQPTNITQLVKNNRKPMLLKGAMFQAQFTVQVPAMQPTPAGPIPDPLMVKQGTAQFITTNIAVRGQ